MRYTVTSYQYVRDFVSTSCIRKCKASLGTASFAFVGCVCFILICRALYIFRTWDWVIMVGVFYVYVCVCLFIGPSRHTLRRGNRFFFVVYGPLLMH